MPLSELLLELLLALPLLDLCDRASESGQPFSSHMAFQRSDFFLAPHASSGFRLRFFVHALLTVYARPILRLSIDPIAIMYLRCLRLRFFFFFFFFFCFSLSLLAHWVGTRDTQGSGYLTTILAG